jgi:hypothetical protein
VLIAFITWAKNLLERQLRLNALSRREQYHLGQAEHHASLERYYGPPANAPFGLNHYEARTHLAGFRMACDEQRMLRNGKSFWQLYDIDKWASQMLHLEKVRSLELAYMWARIPDAAIAPLVQRMTELRWAQERARPKAHFAALPGTASL